MTDDAYIKFRDGELILRDELAIDRTLLANERTLMSYLRSGVALGIAGASIMHFTPSGWFWILGVACIPLGVVVSVIGITRYRTMDQAIRRVRKKNS
jgi:putative membrane protein